MLKDTHPYRSVLYLPASNERALDKARNLPADALIFDLEDAVSPDRKPVARAPLAAALGAGGYGHRRRIVRINDATTDWFADDLAAVKSMPCDGVLLPKVNTPQDVTNLAQGLPDQPIWAMIETLEGVLNVVEIAKAHPMLHGFVLGTNDLGRELGSRPRPDRMPLMRALSLSLMAARAAGLVALDGVYNAFRDSDGLRAECEQGRDLGFDGKTLIHPSQIEVANLAFSPSDAEVALAHRQIAAFEEVTAAGGGVAVVDGQIVENLHVDQARATLAKARAIAELAA